MLQFHYITLTVFVKDGEDEAAIRGKLAALVPLDEKEKIQIRRQVATSAVDLPIVILSITLEKEKHCAQFAGWLMRTLTPEQRQLLADQAPTRLDHGLNFFIRFDKQRWIEQGELQITDSGKCFHCKMSLAAYPAKWERGLAIVRELLH